MPSEEETPPEPRQAVLMTERAKRPDELSLKNKYNEPLDQMFVDNIQAIKRNILNSDSYNPRFLTYDKNSVLSDASRMRRSRI
jgi:hypothetical protein